MTRQEIFTLLCPIVSELLDVAPDEIHEDSDFFADLRADSLHMVDLVMKVEEKLNVEIDDEDVQEMQTVGQVIDYLEMVLKTR